MDENSPEGAAKDFNDDVTPFRFLTLKGTRSRNFRRLWS